jgi:hypothetical protein
MNGMQKLGTGLMALGGLLKIGSDAVGLYGAGVTINDYLNPPNISNTPAYAQSLDQQQAVDPNQTPSVADWMMVAGALGNGLTDVLVVAGAYLFVKGKPTGVTSPLLGDRTEFQ